VAEHERSERVGTEVEPAASSEAAQLFAGQVAPLRRFVRMLVGPPSVAEDVVQETLVRAITSLDRYDPARPVLPWLRGIAVKVAHKHWRRARRARAAEAALADAAAPRTTDPEEEASVLERARRLRRALESLPEPMRVALILHAVERLPAEEVARMTGVSVGAVYTRVCRARERVRAFLDADERTRGDEGKR
jgi:RNA polymerase sigma-70 factor (ECF subfamily)